MDTPDGASISGALWYQRHGCEPSGLWQVTAWLGDAHPDGTVVDGGTTPAGHTLGWSTRHSDVGLLQVDVSAQLAPGAPPLWFVNIDEPGARPAATNLVAFGTDDRPAGTVVDRYAFATMGVRNDQQAGAVRWYRNGLVHQVFVAPAWRRRLVGTAILVTADAWHQANGWPGHLHGDGRRTALGEQFLATLRHPQRFVALDQTMPPMDLPPA